MTDETFQSLCNTYGFAPSRALRELLDCVRAQEIEACAQIAETAPDFLQNSTFDGVAAAIRARSKT